jgi:hypothetical protein
MIGLAAVVGVTSAAPYQGPRLSLASSPATAAPRTDALTCPDGHWIGIDVETEMGMYALAWTR